MQQLDLDIYESQEEIEDVDQLEIFDFSDKFCTGSIDNDEGLHYNTFYSI